MRLAGEVVAGGVGDVDEGEHDGDFDKDADNGGEGGARTEAEDGDGDGNGEFKEVAGAYHAGGGGDGVGQPQGSCPSVCHEEDDDGLQNERDGYQQDMQRVGEDGVALESEQDDECQQEADGGERAELAYKHVVKIVDAAALDYDNAGDDGGGEGDDYKKDYRENECSPRDGHAAYTEQEADYRHESNEDNKVIDSNLHERIGGVSTGEITPDKHHRGTRGSAEQYGAGKILVGETGGDKVLEDDKEE